MGHPNVKWVGRGPVFSGVKAVGIVPGYVSVYSENEVWCTERGRERGRKQKGGGERRRENGNN